MKIFLGYSEDVAEVIAQVGSQPITDHNKSLSAPSAPQPVPCLDPRDDFNCYDYELCGITVHTGTAEGGHYYSYIRQPTPGISPHTNYTFLYIME